MRCERVRAVYKVDPITCVCCVHVCCACAVCWAWAVWQFVLFPAYPLGFLLKRSEVHTSSEVVPANPPSVARIERSTTQRGVGKQQGWGWDGVHALVHCCRYFAGGVSLKFTESIGFGVSLTFHQGMGRGRGQAHERWMHYT